jgi:hypothetical protein
VAAVKKMIAEAERAASGKATKEELSTINKHIRERGYQQAARKAAAAQAPTPTPMAAGEPVAQGMTPEERVIAIDQGYHDIIAKYGEGGAEAVKAMKQNAKMMAKVKDPYFDELATINEVKQVLAGVPAKPPAAAPPVTAPAAAPPVTAPAAALDPKTSMVNTLVKEGGPKVNPKYAAAGIEQAMKDPKFRDAVLADKQMPQSVKEQLREYWKSKEGK